MSYIKRNLAVMSSVMSMIQMAPADMSNMSLAELADMETDDIKAIKTLLFPAGLMAVRGKSALLGMMIPGENEVDKDGNPKRPVGYVDYEFTVLEAQPLDANLDPESMIGRKMTERHTFWPDQLKDLIGLLKGRYKTIELPVDGKLGGLEGAEPGWINGIVEHDFMIKVRHGKPNAQTGIQRVYYEWKPLPKQE